MDALVEVGLGKDSIPALKAALEDKDVEVRRHAIEAAAKLGPDAKPLVGLVADGVREWKIRKTALDALAKFGPAARDLHVLEILKDTLHDKQYRLQAVAAVIAIHPTTPEGKLVVPELITLIELPPTEPNKEIRAEAIKALGKTGYKNAGSELRKLFVDSKAHIRAAAASVLGEMGPDARTQYVAAVLAELQRDQYEEVRQAATDAYKKLYSK
jgi:HEAT repeat protein